MNLIIKLLISTIVVFVLSYFLPGVHVTSLTGALMVAVVLGLLNTFLKPILVLLTIPVTFFTLGLFLLVINAIIILICDYFIHTNALSSDRKFSSHLEINYNLGLVVFSLLTILKLNWV